MVANNMMKPIQPIRQVVQQIGIPDIPAADQDLASQGSVQAILNSGRWIVMCPDDPNGMHAAVVDPANPIFICPGCYPDLRATAFQQGDDGLFRPVPDQPKRDAAQAQAAADGHSYMVVFPDNMADIMDAVRQRPVEAMNWLPSESLDFLQQENAEHNIGATQPDTTVSGGN